MELWQLGDVKRCQLIDELRRHLDRWETHGTQNLQAFLGIPIAGWVDYLSEGIHGQSDTQLRTILRHVLGNKED